VWERSFIRRFYFFTNHVSRIMLFICQASRKYTYTNTLGITIQYIIVSRMNNLNSVFHYDEYRIVKTVWVTRIGFNRTTPVFWNVLFFSSIRNGKLMAIGDHIGLPDDVSVGFVIGMYIASCAQTYFTFVLLYFAVFCIVYIMIYIYIHMVE